MFQAGSGSGPEEAKHEDENGNFEDNTAFGDTLDIGNADEARDRAEKADDDDENNKQGTVADDIVNFYMDNQYLKAKWRKENLRNVGKWLATTLGLIVAVLLFCTLGGFMFNSMEELNEIENCKTNRDKYYQARDKARDAVAVSGSNFQLSQTERLDAFKQAMETLISAYRNATWRGKDCNSMIPEWNMVSAMFFCGTVVTSIGYGYIAPMTFWGRCVLIAYAVIGIPLYLAALANMGAFFSNVTHYAYHNLCCCGTCRENRMDSESKKQMQAQMMALWRTEPNAPGAHFLDALEDDSGGESSEEEAADEQAALELVPISATMIILASVIIFGGSIFSVTEDWPFVDGVYFSFVTVATIGFGDLVPGLVGTKERHSTIKFGMLWFYIIFGMTILSMCLQMLQENVEESVRNLLKIFNGSKKSLRQQNGEAEGQEKNSDTSSSEGDYYDDNDRNKNFHQNNDNNGYDYYYEAMARAKLNDQVAAQLMMPDSQGLMMMPPDDAHDDPFNSFNPFNEFNYFNMPSNAMGPRGPIMLPPQSAMTMGGPPGMMYPNGSAMIRPPMSGMPMPPPPMMGSAYRPPMMGSAYQMPPSSAVGPSSAYRPPMMAPPSAVDNNRLSSAYQEPGMFRPAPQSAVSNFNRDSSGMYRAPPSAVPQSSMMRPPPSAVSNISRESSARNPSARQAPSAYRGAPTAADSDDDDDENSASRAPASAVSNNRNPSARQVPSAYRASAVDSEDDDDESNAPQAPALRPPPSAVSNRENSARNPSARQAPSAYRGAPTADSEDDDEKNASRAPTSAISNNRNSSARQVSSAYRAPVTDSEDDDDESNAPQAPVLRPPPSAVSNREKSARTSSARQAPSPAKPDDDDED